jgi:hypothetical protein
VTLRYGEVRQLDVLSVLAGAATSSLGPHWLGLQDLSGNLGLDKLMKAAAEDSDGSGKHKVSMFIPLQQCERCLNTAPYVEYDRLDELSSARSRSPPNPTTVPIRSPHRGDVSASTLAVDDKNPLSASGCALQCDRHQLLLLWMQAQHVMLCAAAHVHCIGVGLW